LGQVVYHLVDIVSSVAHNFNHRIYLVSVSRIALKPGMFSGLIPNNSNRPNASPRKWSESLAIARASDSAYISASTILAPGCRSIGNGRLDSRERIKAAILLCSFAIYHL
jgi:hypothetical protein